MQAFIYGRVDVFRSIYVLLDHLKITSAPIYKVNGGYWSFK